jgi:hypothetical protein
MNRFIKKMFGIDKIEARIEQSLQQADSAKKLAEEATVAAERAREAERVSKLTPKELATEKKEPYIDIQEIKVNKDNVRNGFFELDWNEYFVLQLTEAGYIGVTEEEIVDLWFQELCRNVGAEAGVEMERRGSGYVNRALRDDGRTEIF